jgi:uncharacterized protein (DUF1697 family)
LRTALFLRAVNLKGRSLPMAQFREILAQAGLAGAETLGASGNAVVSAPAGSALEAQVEAALSQALGRTTEVFARDHASLAAALAGNPFEDFARDQPSRLHVVLLKGPAEAARVAALQAKIAGRETVAAGPGCLYATYPDGAGASKLTMAVIERALGGRGTARNWNTLRRMVGLTGAR